MPITPTVYTDFLNVALDSLTTTLQTILNLQVVNDSRNIVPPCALINSPSIEAYNNKIVKAVFTVQVMTLGPGNLDGERSLLSMVAKLIDKNVAVTSGRPTNIDIGGTVLPAYELIIPIMATSNY
jgi:hypothetical protein